ncbi:MAG TPA: hypothetical protein VF980_00290 [Thermoanaerobaculia bacterium]
MKKFVLAVVILVAIALALALYLKSTTPRTSAGARLPLTDVQRELLAAVPSSAQVFALIPTAAACRAKLIANPITRGPVMEWADRQQLPHSWMIGAADLVVWRSGNQTSYAIHLDPMRAVLVRMYLMLGSGPDARVSAGTLLINAAAGSPLGSERIDQLLSPIKDAGAGDAIVVQQDRGRGSFPPIGRPAVTLVQIGANDIVLTSLAPATPSAAQNATQTPRFARAALIAATFRQSPRVASDLDRLFLAKVSHLLDDGGSIVLYDVNAGTLLPRPDGVLIANATPENLETAAKIEEPVRAFGDLRTSGDQILLAFDKDSMDRYQKDSFVNGQWPTNDWAVRVDPKRTLPILEKLSDSAGLRLAAPRLYRSARDLRGWISYLSAADSIEAAHSTSGGTEELRVRIAAK